MKKKTANLWFSLLAFAVVIALVMWFLSYL